MEQQKLDLETTINQAFNDTGSLHLQKQQKTKDARLTSFNNSKDRFDEGIIDALTTFN